MPFYRHYVYPHLINALGDPKPIREIRRQIVPLAEGKVLEVGVRTGANFSHYDAARVSKIYALEPNPGMIRLAERERRRTVVNVEFLDLPGESIPLEEGSIDTVGSTFTFCTITGVVEAIRGIARVLRPGGKLIFFEHGNSSDPQVQRWLRSCEPLTRLFFEGCHLTRDIPSLITDGGFRMEQMQTGSLAEFPKASTHCWWGTAIPK